MFRFTLIALLSLTYAQHATADEVDYLKQVKPVLQTRCYPCHGVLKQKAGLRLDTAAFAIKGGDNPVIVPGDAANSDLIERIASKDDSTRMPPEGEPLKENEISAIHDWIVQGAKAPANESPERDPREHWAFQKPVRPEKPVLHTFQEWVKTPIDSFIAREYETHKLAPQKDADKKLLLRRVKLDLTGLPPSLEELKDFEEDRSPEAYEKVVDRLLSSPQYGERWGRHWMDVWRYSDWWGLGAEVRNSQKHIWHWRDWIVESINADKGYDQMLREMLAADELYPNDLNKLRGSGFLARQYFKFNRTSWLDETVEHTAKSMLGLTFNCAKCHDHKYDPFSQVEYYKFRAFFEPYQIRTDMVPGELDLEKDGIPRAFDCNLDAPTFLHIRGDDRNPDKSKPLEAAIPAFLGTKSVDVKAVNLPPEAYQPGLRDFVLQNALDDADRSIVKAKNSLEQAEANRNASESRVERILASPFLEDSIYNEAFYSVNEHDWKQIGGTWEKNEGKSPKLSATGGRAVLQIRRKVPADFEARLRYRPIAGGTWKSVGISFDAGEQNEISAYASSHEGGNKVQLSYKELGNFVYPAAAAQRLPVRLGVEHELAIRVRRDLVNISFNGAHSVAYRLPIPRQDGSVQLTAFDVMVDLLHFDIKPLDTTYDMVEPGGKNLSNPLEATLAYEVASAKLREALEQPASIKARSQADWFKHHDPKSVDLTKLTHEAARSQAQVELHKAEAAKFQAEWDLLQSPKDKKAEFANKLQIARQTYETFHKNINAPKTEYTSLLGSLKTFESNLETEASRKKPFPTTSSGRRSALAGWITDRSNPLPARVAVNHIWLRHFGKPLVPTLFDFGRKGTPPTHTELLDWLAVELIESGWSMKHLHKLMVLSHVYRLGSTTLDDSKISITNDPENKDYWHANPLRMDANAVRDSLLSLAGELDLTMGGPTIPTNKEDSKRRSLYYFHSHNDHSKFLELFDDANVLECYRRSESIVPQQALALENSGLAYQSAQKIAARISSQSQADLEFIKTAFVTILASDPTESEIEAARDALLVWEKLSQAAGRPDPKVSARVNLVHALLNHNDFVTIR